MWVIHSLPPMSVRVFGISEGRRGFDQPGLGDMVPNHETL